METTLESSLVAQPFFVSKYVANAAGEFFRPNGAFKCHFNNYSSKAWICSLNTQYSDYCAYELKRHPSVSNRRKMGLLFLLRVQKRFFQWLHVDNVAYPTHNLCSTELWGEELARYLKKMSMHPNHRALVFRSLSPQKAKKFQQAVGKKGVTLFYREALVLEPGVMLTRRQRKQHRCDLALLETHGYSCEFTNELTEELYERLEVLYRSLYLDKYTALNPVYTKAFFKLAARRDEFHYYLLKKQGRLDAFGLFQVKNGEMQLACIGYDNTLPASVGLYRQLAACAIQYAKENQLRFYMSDGCAKFKMLRGAKPYTEYCGVYFGGASWRTRLKWRLLAYYLNRFWAKWMSPHFFGLAAYGGRK